VYTALSSTSTPLLALPATWSLLSDVVVTSPTLGTLRSSWSTTAVPIPYLGPLPVNGSGNGTAAPVGRMEDLPLDVAEALIRAVAANASRSASRTSFLLTLNGATNLTLIAATGSRFVPGTRVLLSGLPCPFISLSADGALLTVSSPPYSAVCPDGPTSCLDLELLVSPPELLNNTELVALATGAALSQETEANLIRGRRSVSLPVLCPPFCPGADTSLSVYVASSTTTGAAAVIAGFPDPVTFAGRRLQVIPASSRARTAGRATLSYVESCSAGGFPDPTTGVCSDPDSPLAPLCAFGR
jgi:hypothetical protein